MGPMMGLITARFILLAMENLSPTHEKRAITFSTPSDDEISWKRITYEYICNLSAETHTQHEGYGRCLASPLSTTWKRVSGRQNLEKIRSECVPCPTCLSFFVPIYFITVMTSIVWKGLTFQGNRNKGFLRLHMTSIRWFAPDVSKNKSSILWDTWLGDWSDISSIAAVLTEPDEPQYGNLKPIGTPPLIFHTVTIDFIVAFPLLENGFNNNDELLLWS